mmetsp:Transcript_7755/g.28124  ORF Transcript_7755/g.28124 Transcript_7755/m.28124 type:complete len:411 (-) Transcript_7755:83-1315(-)
MCGVLHSQQQRTAAALLSLALPFGLLSLRLLLLLEHLPRGLDGRSGLLLPLLLLLSLLLGLLLLLLPCVGVLNLLPELVVVPLVHPELLHHLAVHLVLVLVDLLQLVHVDVVLLDPRLHLLLALVLLLDQLGLIFPVDNLQLLQLLLQLSDLLEQNIKVEVVLLCVPVLGVLRPDHEVFHELLRAGLDDLQLVLCPDLCLPELSQGLLPLPPLDPELLLERELLLAGLLLALANLLKVGPPRVLLLHRHGQPPVGSLPQALDGVHEAQNVAGPVEPEGLHVVQNRGVLAQVPEDVARRNLVRLVLVELRFVVQILAALQVAHELRPQNLPQVLRVLHQPGVDVRQGAELLDRLVQDGQDPLRFCVFDGHLGLPKVLSNSVQRYHHPATKAQEQLLAALPATTEVPALRCA